FRTAAFLTLLTSMTVLALVVGGGVSGLTSQLVGAASDDDAGLVATVYDPYDSELLAPYARLRTALAAGDPDELLAVATEGSGYDAYLAADDLWRRDDVDSTTRLAAIERMLDLRMPDSLRRV